jgi:hypothetical protein
MHPINAGFSLALPYLPLSIKIQLTEDFIEDPIPNIQ